jgi:GT2 family glycosyltransferase/glycosyltransferase involved in cell wall biosynthesis
LDSIFASDQSSPLWTPKLLDKPSGWWAHVPFAFWIIAACKPRVLAELGTHYGVSYAAFCEAILRLRLATRSYAVDSWAGDPQAGFYGDEVFSELASFHDRNYSAFSELIRMPFDEANHQFTNGSIDVLHIDGYHTYEAVSHDFDLWRPKLSNRGVVLFHDTNVHRNDFGVWRFFQELSQTTPCFEFLHGYGLGVACVGAEAPEAVQELCRLDGAAAAAVRDRFSQLGAVWVSANHALLEARRHLARLSDLEAENAELNSKIALIYEERQQKDAQMRALQEEGRQKDAQLRALQQDGQQKDAQLRALQQDGQQKDAQLRVLKEEGQRLEQVLQSADRDNRALLAAAQKSNRDIVRWLAVLKRGDITRPVPRQLTGWRWLPPGRWKKRRRLVRDYRLIAESPLLDPEWYLAKNPDIAVKVEDPVLHYLLYGAREGRAPGPNFDGSGYFTVNPDVASFEVNPLVHYIQYGHEEDRRIWADPPRFLSVPDSDELTIPELNDKTAEALDHLRPSTSNARLENIVSLGQMSDGPLSVCFVLPILSDDKASLDRTIQSVLRQTDPTWELLLVSGKRHAEFARDWLDVDWRIRYIESDVSDLPSVAKLATNGFLLNLRQGDALDDDYILIFLRRLKEMILQSTAIDLVYVDELLYDENNNLIGSIYKPDWSPEHLESVNYIGRGFAVRKSLLLSMSGALPSGSDAADYALLLDVAARAQTILHIDEGLYLSCGPQNRDASGCFSTEALPEARASLERKVHAENPHAEVRSEATGALDVVWPVPSEPITLVILTGLSRDDRVNGGKTALVTNFVRSIVEKSTCKSYKILVVDDGEAPEDLSALLAANGHESHSFKHNGAFSFAKKVNFAVNLAPDGVVILLNDDMEVISPDWIQRLAGLAARRGVGAVGALLLFPEGTIQHAGIVIGYHGGAGHIFHRSEPNGGEYGRFATVQRNYAAVTGAAIAFRKSVFVALGGFDERFSTDYNDVDFCLRCIEAGYRIVQSPAARLYHFHNSSYKRPHDDPAERSMFVERWGAWIDRDPYYSKHFQRRHHELPLVDGTFDQRTVPGREPKLLHSTESDYRELLSRLDHEANEALPKLHLAQKAGRGNATRSLARQVGCILRLGLFDKDFYLDLYPDIRAAGLEPIRHYMQSGDFEGRLPNAIFDPQFYRGQFRGKTPNGITALYHYAVAGEKAGLSASASFNPKRYITSNPDMSPWLDHPLTHYLHIGRSRGFATRHNIRLSAEQRVVPQKSQPPASVDVSRLKRAVNIIGPLDRLSGLGVSARGYLRAFQELDIVPVGSQVRTREFGIQASVVGQSPFPKFLPDAGINVVHMNGDTLPLMMEHGGRDFLYNRYNIAIWYWELATLRPEWLQFMKYFHEFWAPTRFIERAIARSTNLPVRLVPPYLPHLKTMGLGGRKGDKPRFVYCFDANSILERKNPVALLDAFQKAFPEGEARLTFKITYPNRSIPEIERLYAARDADSRVEIIDENISDQALYELIASATAYASPHRSEGLGLTVIEAMASGVPVIATPYGGVEQFVRPDVAYPIDYRMVELKDDYPPYPRGYVWADPDIASLALRLREVVDNGEDGRVRAERARANVIDVFASQQLLEKYRDELERICKHIFD